jgi:hypothetical protein
MITYPDKASTSIVAIANSLNFIPEKLGKEAVKDYWFYPKTLAHSSTKIASSKNYPKRMMNITTTPASASEVVA